ncbi:hypothetical protein BG005_003677, partial [Podila minutissima]
MSKSQTTPTQRIDHLGYTINTISMTLEVPGNKIRDIRQEVNRMAQKGVTTLHQLSSFIGRVTTMLRAVFPAQLQTRHLLQVKNDTLKMGSKWSNTVKITDE